MKLKLATQLTAMGITAMLAPAAIALAAQDTPAGVGSVRVGMLEAFFVQRHPITRQVEWIGSFIIWALLILSGFCIAFLVMRLQENRKRDIIAPEIERRARERAASGLPNEIAAMAANRSTFFESVLKSAVDQHPHGHSAMIRAAETASETLTYRRLRAIEPLNVVGNVAPMIGLFGTVYGMILAFRQIVLGGGTPDPVALANGIGTALVTTFWGLIVAIPALSGYALLRNKIDGLTSEATRAVEEVIGLLRGPGDSR